jgi:hypothetical protein
MHTEQLHNFYLPDTGITESKRMQWAEYVTCTEEMRNVYKILVKNHKGRRLFRTLISKWSLKREE